MEDMHFTASNSKEAAVRDALLRVPAKGKA